MIKCSKKPREGSRAKCSVCRWLLWLSTDRSFFTHPVTRCDAAGVWYTSKRTKWNHRRPRSVSFSLCPFHGKGRGRRKGWEIVFLHLKKWLYSSWLIQRQNHWQPECQNLSRNHQALREPSAKLPPVCTPVTPQLSEQNTDMPSTDPSENEQNFPSASYNLTSIYKPLQMDVSILFHLGICANMLIHTVNFTVNAKFRITQPDINS